MAGHPRNWEAAILIGTGSSNMRRRSEESFYEHNENLDGRSPVQETTQGVSDQFRRDQRPLASSPTMKLNVQTLSASVWSSYWVLALFLVLLNLLQSPAAPSLSD